MAIENFSSRNGYPSLSWWGEKLLVLTPANAHEVDFSPIRVLCWGIYSSGEFIPLINTIFRGKIKLIILDQYKFNK
jgi:hypothetical protein